MHKRTIFWMKEKYYGLIICIFELYSEYRKIVAFYLRYLIKKLFPFHALYIIGESNIYYVLKDFNQKL